MKHTVCFKTEVVAWTLLFSFFLWNGNGWAQLPSDETQNLMPASQGLQPAEIVDPDGGGCEAFASLFVKGCDPPEEGDTISFTNDSGGVEVLTYTNGIYLTTTPHSGAEVASAVDQFLPMLSRRFVAKDLNSEFFISNSFSREAGTLLSKNLRFYGYKFSDSDSLSVALIRQLSLPSFIQETNINDDSTTADLFKLWSFDNDVSILSVRGINNSLPRLQMGPDINDLSVIGVRTVLNDDRLKALMIQEVNNGRFVFGRGMIQELLQKDAYEIRSDKVVLQNGEEPSLAVDSFMETNAKIDSMRSFQSGPQPVAFSTALKGGTPYMEESDPVADSLSMNDPPVVRSAADSFRALIKKYPGLSIDDMNVKLIEGHMDLDRIGEGYTSPWNWMETMEPAPITSVLSVTG